MTARLTASYLRGFVGVSQPCVSQSKEAPFKVCNNSLTHACMHVEVKLSRPEQKKSFNDQPQQCNAKFKNIVSEILK